MTTPENCDQSKWTHTHGTCQECEGDVPSVTVQGPHWTLTTHDDGSFCSAIVQFIPPTYIPGSRPELHNKRTKMLYPNPRGYDPETKARY